MHYSKSHVINGEQKNRRLQKGEEKKNGTTMYSQNRIKM